MTNLLPQDSNHPFYLNASLTVLPDRQVGAKRPGLYTYNLTRECSFLSAPKRPFTPAPYRSVNADWWSSLSFLGSEERTRVCQVLDYLKRQAEVLIDPECSRDQEVLIVHGWGNGLPSHKHGLPEGSETSAVSFCIRAATKDPSFSPIFLIGDTVYSVFYSDTEVIAEFALDTVEAEHQVIVSKNDPNVYLWYVLDGVKFRSDFPTPSRVRAYDFTS